jgi:ribokinase
MAVKGCRGVESQRPQEGPEEARPVPDGPLSRVFVVGSANQDLMVTVPELPAPGQTVQGIGIESMPGGKGANQAVAAARAGAPVVFVGAVGNDDAGRRSLEALRSEGVDVSAVLVHPTEPTGTAVVTVAADGENQIAIVAGANGALSGAQVAAALTGAGLGPRDLCLVCFEIPDDAVAAASRAARLAGATLLVNPAPARPLVEETLRSAPLLLPNDSEAQALAGTTGEAAARHLRALTGAPVVVTLGGEGVLVLDDRPARTVPARKVEVVDTTGAGDTFAGVLAASLAAGRDLDAAVERAVVAAGLSVGVPGAREGSPRADRIEAALAGPEAPARAG